MGGTAWQLLRRIAEGIALKLPHLKPFVLPDRIYGNLSSTPILTLATRSILIASRKLSITVVYDLNAAILDRPQLLASHYPLILEELVKDFDPQKLTFPLHEGSLRFMNKDLPNVLERHAEFLSLLLAVIIALSSGLYALFKYRQRRG